MASDSCNILTCSQISEKHKWIWRRFRKQSFSSHFLGFFFRMCFTSLEKLAWLQVNELSEEWCHRWRGKQAAASVAGCCHISAAAHTSPNQGQEIEPEAGVL